MRFQGKGKDLENPGQFKLLKKDVARIQTVLTQRVRQKVAAQEAAAQGSGKERRVPQEEGK